MLVSSITGASMLCIFEQWIMPGHGAPTHVHAVEEVLTIIEGEAEVWVGPERQVLEKEQSVIIPSGSAHGFRNTGSTRLHMRAILAEPSFNARYLESGNDVSRWNPEDENR